MIQSNRCVSPANAFANRADLKISEGCSYASPAVSNGQLFLRTDQSLYCIGAR